MSQREFVVLGLLESGVVHRGRLRQGRHQFNGVVRIGLGLLHLLRIVRHGRFHAPRDGHRQEGQHIHVIGIQFECLGSRREHLVRVPRRVIRGSQHPVNSADIPACGKFSQ